MTDWRNRIIRYGTQAADQFAANPRNPRKHPQKQRDAVHGSLNTLGWIAPVVVNVRTGYVIDGHERIWQALANDNADVPLVEVDLSEDEEALALATFDFITYMAEYDRDNLDALLREVNTDDAALQATIAELGESVGLYTAPVDAPEPQIDRADELQDKWQVQTGDTWQVGRHTVICGDAHDYAHEVADLYFCDPPFDMDYSEQANILSAIRARQIVWMSATPAAYEIWQYITRNDYRFTIFWDGVLAMSVPNKRRPIISVDLLLCFGSDGLFNNEAAISHFGCSEAQVPHYLRIVRPVPNVRQTKWEKPIALVRGFVELLSNPGDRVVDLFLSSGTTLVAAEQTGRVCSAVEIEPKFVAVTLERATQMGLDVQKKP